MKGCEVWFYGNNKSKKINAKQIKKPSVFLQNY
jgi:hypothetical protein